MIRYTVVWQQDAEDELTTLWCDRVNRQAITNAADRIDVELAIDPQQKGIALLDGLRAISIPPLTVGFEIDDGDRKVFVVLVKLTA